MGWIEKSGSLSIVGVKNSKKGRDYVNGDEFLNSSPFFRNK